MPMAKRKGGATRKTAKKAKKAKRAKKK